MESFEVSIDDELFLISERHQLSGSVSFDFAWLNGPAEGTYGFTLGVATLDSSTGQHGRGIEMSKEELVHQARDFLDSFYGPEVIGAEDFPDHPAARRS